MKPPKFLGSQSWNRLFGRKKRSTPRFQLEKTFTLAQMKNESLLGCKVLLLEAPQDFFLAGCHPPTHQLLGDFAGCG